MTTNANDYQAAELVAVGKAESMILGEKEFYVADTIWLFPTFLRDSEIVWSAHGESAD